MKDNGNTFHARDGDEVLKEMDVDAGAGLSEEEVERRREQYGRNELREAERRSAWVILFDQFKSIVIIVLVVAAVVAFATARWPEGIALVCVTAVNALIGFFSEWKAVRSMEALRQLGKLETQVRRGGEKCKVGTTDLVPGDIVILESENLVPADMRLLEGESLRVNEAALTGESVPVNKRTEATEQDAPLAERTSMLYKGTTVSEGRATGVVVATGMKTELGRISELAEHAEEKATPLQQRLDRLGQRMVWITLGVAAVVAVAGLLAGRDAVLMIETSIALGVAAVPEGLPIVATIALARGMWLMAKRNALINRLTAVETLGATRVIFTDKTGTLTENRMSVARVVTAEGDHGLEEDEKEETGKSSLLKRVIRIGVLCNNATLRDDEDEGKNDSGDPTEIALLEAGKLFGMKRAELLDESPEKREESFDPDVMMLATFHAEDDGYLVAVKGAPRSVVESCSKIADEDGERDWDDEERQEWLDQADKLAGEGLRLLAMADKRTGDTDASPYEELCFVGLVGMADPARGDVKEAIEECQRAGIRVVMVTGDRPDTGKAIGEQVGLNKASSAVHGNELSDLDELSEEDKRRVLETDVFARVTPEQKLNLVELYQDEGEIVAMTGDGVNDAPALKQADIGVAMGKRGTDAAKQVSDMVLRDDAFTSIVAAVREGRIIFANIRKSVMFMLCTNFAEILAVASASLAQVPIPLSPLQILYLNVLTDVFPALALGVGKGGPGVMDRKPRDPDEAVLTRHHWLAVAGWSVVVSACVLGALSLALVWLGLEEVEAVTVSFLTLGFGKLWFVFNLRDRGSSLIDNDVTRNPWIWGALVLCASLLLVAVYWPPLANVLPASAPGAKGWMVALGLSLVPALCGIFAPGIRFHHSAGPGESEKKKSGR